MRWLKTWMTTEPGMMICLFLTLYQRSISPFKTSVRGKKRLNWAFKYFFRPAPRAAFGSARNGKNAYLFGGRCAPGRANDLYHFDLVHHVWTRLDSNGARPENRSWMTLTGISFKFLNVEDILSWSGLYAAIRRAELEKRTKQWNCSLGHLDFRSKPCNLNNRIPPCAAISSLSKAVETVWIWFL